MFVYNTTYHVDVNVVEAFLDWIKSDYIPVATKSGVLRLPRLALIMNSGDNASDEHRSYSLQFEVESIDLLQCWYGADGVDLVNKLTSKFAQKVVGFTTIMSIVDL